MITLLIDPAGFDFPTTRVEGEVYQHLFRARRVAVVALARKLLVALWRYVTQGVLPEGARLKAA